MALGADADQNLSIVVRLKDEASKQLATLKDKIGEVQQQMAGNAVDASNKFALGLGAVGAGMAALIGKGVAVAGDLEAARQGFVTLLGSAEAADKTMAKIKLAAASTPFEVQGLTKAVQMMSAVTHDGDKAIQTILDLGQGLATAGRGQAELDRIAINMQQIGAIGHASMIDIKQFGFAGIQIFDMLKEKTGLAGDALSEFISNGGVTYSLLTDMFHKATLEGGKWAGGFKNQAGTFIQLMSNMWDVTNLFLADLVTSTGVFDGVKKAISGITDVLSKNREGIFQGIKDGIKWFKDNAPLVVGIIVGGLTPAILGLVASFVSLATALAPFMLLGAGIGVLIQGLRDGDPVMAGIGATITAIVVPAFISLSGTILASVVPAIGALVVAFAPFIIGGVLIGGLVAGVVWLTKHWDEVKAKAQEVWGFVAPYLTGIWQNISGVAMAIWTGISDFFKAFWEGIKNVFLFTVALIAGAVITYFKSMGIDIVAVWETVKNAASAFWEFISNAFDVGVSAIKVSWTVGWTAIKNFVGPIWQGIKDFVGEGWEWVLGKFKEYQGPVTDAWTFLWNAIGAVVDTVWQNIKTSVLANLNWILSKIQVVIDAVNKVAAAGGNAIGVSAPQIPSIPHLATGTNYVPNDTLAVLHKGEAVVPAKYNPSAGGNGGGVYITINNPVVRDQRDLDQLKSQMSDIFRSLNINRKLSMS